MRYFILNLCLGLVFVLSGSGCEKSPKQKGKEVFSPEAIQQGVQLLPTYCNTCHGVGDREMDEMLSPALWAIREHYLVQYPEPEAFVDAMVEFMQFPRESTALMPVEVKEYGLMTTVSLSEADLRATAIAIYIGEVERPSWARSYERKHSSWFKK